jgi:hypothetical protein
MSQITVHIKKEESLERFLNMNHFQVESLSENVQRVQRADEVPVFLNITGNTIFFEVDLGSLQGIGSENLYFNLLNLNTEILPVSFGINNSNAEDPRLVLTESREIQDLDDHELLSVFDALELAVDKAEQILTPLLEQA